MTDMRTVTGFIGGAFLLAIPYWIVQTTAAQNILDTIVDIVPTRN